MSRIDNRWYDDLADSWWDRDGPVAALHEVNPVRGGYFLDVLGLETSEGAGPRILDLGCGGGLMAEIYAGAGAWTVGLDPSRQSLQAARRHQCQLANPLYLAGRGEELPFADATFDAVCAADSLEHVAQLERVLDECVRVLRPGGRFVFDTINRTFRSRLVMIWAAQNWLRLAPAHTHAYEAFIRPEELRSALERRGMRWGELRGLSFQQNALRAGWSYWRTRRLGGFRLSDDTGISYLGYAEKPR